MKTILLLILEILGILVLMAKKWTIYENETTFSSQRSHLASGKIDWHKKKIAAKYLHSLVRPGS